MKPTIDQFSGQAKLYQKYRPVYPQTLYQDILQLVPDRGTAWDCGTGNGQVASTLAQHFRHVYATDISQAQLDQAPQKENISYRLVRSEKTDFADHSFDLVTVAQALHWFDHQAFNKELHRVAKAGAIFAAWGYDLLRVEPAIDKLIGAFYLLHISSYWKAERRHVETHYRSIPLAIEEIALPRTYEIKTAWTLDNLQGYLNSWSSIQNYMAAHDGRNPVPELIDQLRPHWPAEEKKEIRFPIFVRIGKIS